MGFVFFQESHILTFSYFENKGKVGLPAARAPFPALYRQGRYPALP
jgi:hypothetical protein